MQDLKTNCFLGIDFYRKFLASRPNSDDPNAEIYTSFSKLLKFEHTHRRYPHNMSESEFLRLADPSVPSTKDDSNYIGSSFSDEIQPRDLTFFNVDQKQIKQIRKQGHYVSNMATWQKEWHFMGSDRRIPTEPLPENKWNFLEAFMHPFDSLIISDRYIYTQKYVNQLIPKIIRWLTCDPNQKVKVLVVGANDIENAGMNLDYVADEINRELKNKNKKLSEIRHCIEVKCVHVPKKGCKHDRELITNYLHFTFSTSLHDLFKDYGTITLSPLYNHINDYRSLLEFLCKVYKNECREFDIPLLEELAKKI